jgi:hypothetical protein
MIDMNKSVFFLVFFTALCFLTGAQDLTITKDDLHIEFKADGGFHLYIRKKGGIGSVLLTESTRDPQLISDNYAYRAGEWNPVNGDEIRIIDGKPIPKENGIYSLISSTPNAHPEFGQAFHIYIPYVLYYGYAESRHGEVFVSDGTYLNIRAFTLPYADYRGAFMDNPFVMEANQVPPSGNIEGNFLPETVESFKEIAKSGGGELIYVNGTDELIERIRDALKKEAGKNVDIVICLDTTGSMKKYIDHVRGRLVPMMKELVVSFESWRIGMVLYKDYNEAYLTKIIPFTNDFAKFQKDIDDIKTGGGGDIPEAVYEALYTGAAVMPWTLDTKIMFLIGDAPPHPKPRGKITKALLDAVVAEKGIKVNAVILPQ